LAQQISAGLKGSATAGKGLSQRAFFGLGVRCGIRGAHGDRLRFRLKARSTARNPIGVTGAIRKRKLRAAKISRISHGCGDRFRPISDLRRQTLAHADAGFDLIPGLLIELNDGRVGLKDLQIDLDAAEHRQTAFSF
jgi:hypothetical protein